MLFIATSMFENKIKELFLLKKKNVESTTFDLLLFS